MKNKNILYLTLKVDNFKVFQLFFIIHDNICNLHANIPFDILFLAIFHVIRQRQTFFK
jgi:hypothetical protein